MSKLHEFINTAANEEGLYDSDEVDNIEKEIRAEAIEDFANLLKEIANTSSTKWIRVSDSVNYSCYRVDELVEMLNSNK